MPSRPQPRKRCIERKIPSSIRRMDTQIRKRNKSPPPRISTLLQHSPRRISRSPRHSREMPVSNVPFKRSPKKPLMRKPIRRNVSPLPLRQRDLSKPRERTPEKNYPHTEVHDRSDQEHQRTTYSVEDLKSVKLEIEGYKKVRDKYTSKKSDRNTNIITTFNPDDFVLARRPGEGSTPIFEGLPIRQSDENDLEQTQSDRLSYGPSSSYNDTVQEREFYTDKGRERTITNIRRSIREDYDDYNKERTRTDELREERTRTDETRYHPQINFGRSRSFDRLRNVTIERRDRYEERNLTRGLRRSLDRDRDRERDRERERLRERERDRDRDRIRGRSDERLSGRRPSPSPRRHVDHLREYEDRRPRSLDRRSRSLDRSSGRRDSYSHVRDQEHSSRDKFSSNDHSPKSRGYNSHGEENSGHSSRGRGMSFFSIGRGGGMPGRPFIRNAIIRPQPPIMFRGMPMGRGPLGRRLPFPPSKSFHGPLHGRH